MTDYEEFLLAAIHRVRDLHQPISPLERGYNDHGTSICRECNSNPEAPPLVAWPCPTILALDAGPTPA